MWETILIAMVQSVENDMLLDEHTVNQNYLDSVHVVGLTTLVEHNCDIIVTNVSLLTITPWVRLSGGHNGGNVEYNLVKQRKFLSYTW